MVESGNIITIFFGQFESQYIGSPFMINGNQIYSAFIRSYGITKAKSLFKVSHGIFHNILSENVYLSGKSTYNKRDWKGFPVGDRINLSSKTINTYNDFFQLRSYQTPFIKNTTSQEYDRILRHHSITIRSGENIPLIQADRLSFFTVTEKELEINDVQLQLGAKRNMGFGLLNITNQYSFDIDSLDYSIFHNNQGLIDTAKSGITGILNHSKYGFGEFQIDSWGTKEWLIRLTSPLCLESTIPNSRIYENPPPFMISAGYRKCIEYLWIKNNVEKLSCISDGMVFRYDDSKYA